MGKPMVTLDAARDFHELTRLKLAVSEAGLLMIAGGVPKNFAQDVVIAADLLGAETPMHTKSRATAAYVSGAERLRPSM